MTSAGRQKQWQAACDAILIGGSAGGLEAATRVLSGLPAEVAAPIVVVLHVARHRPSQLAEVLTWSIGRPVEEAQDKAPLPKGAIYVAPPDYHLLIDDGPVLALSVDEPHNRSLPSIDVLFESAADVLGPGVVAVVLSGANEDGAHGLRAVVDAGGYALIQAPDEAAAPEMPEAAARANPGVPVLPVRELIERLLNLTASPDH